MNVASAEPRTILDDPESIFPLDLDTRIPKIRDLYHLATVKQWDPRTDIDWHLFDATQYTPEQRYAARQYWSRRAWSEYGAISESPALQIRFCHDKCEPDLRLFFTIRSQEESRHAEACYRMAEALGGYMEQPAQAAYQGPSPLMACARWRWTPKCRSRRSLPRWSAPPRKSRSTSSATWSRSPATPSPSRSAPASCATRCGTARSAGAFSTTAFRRCPPPKSRWWKTR